MIQARALCKRYGRAAALRGVSLEARAGEVTALIGPNGSGKSTLIKILLGLTRADEGDVCFDGAPIGNDWRYRSRIGYMPQTAHFPGNLSGREVVALLKELRTATASFDEELFEQLNLARELHKPVSALSGGTRQKLNAALAFMFRPALFILDEPTASLDPLSSAILKAKIRKEQQRGAGFLITSHIMAEVQALATRVVYLSEGALLFDEPTEALLRQAGQGSLEQAIVTVVGAR